MNVELILFYFFAAMVLGSALLVVTVRNLVRSIFLFFVALFAIAGLYIFALADFVAVAQVIVYVGGILVLMLFAFLLSNKELLNDLQLLKVKLVNVNTIPALLVASIFLFILVSVISQSGIDDLPWLKDRSAQLQPIDNTIHYIGINIMTRYLLPFEAVSIFLMMALIGAAHLARKENRA